MKQNLILDHKAIVQKTKRIAHQIVEDNFDEKEIVMIGIQPTGYVFAEMLKKEIEAIAKIKIHLFSMVLDKLSPKTSTIELDLKGIALDKRNILLVDDVANTGKTMFYALSPILAFSPKKVQVAVLIDRLHKQFPISSDFVGLSLSTTLKEQILVKHEKSKFSAYLT
jgi:pyrimidine operon attenuation protein/uracil phosphoribosyltransferase